ncbi:hypothetical protein VPNG_01343 [Cytospora leucostoma]|uniref:Jacalin-type lectin domain-containing protein n=1 Tax=Cytospora leucostoma TaxID=1230097 RepID=A0A423XL23_9PEZI|nr:hypothetical protein VPNG_01343 [Cytospora leucostoma]
MSHRRIAKMLSTAAATVLFLTEAAAAQTTSGDFSILSMNVAGLPQVLQNNDVTGDKTTNSELIGKDFAEYDFDVIHVQEDFNYHAYIYETDDHPYRTATSGGAGIGSGLNTLANFPWVDFTRIKWDICSNVDSDDCLTPKGFTFMRVQIAASSDNSTAVYADFYNLHADAGTTDDDETARNSNINQVLTYIDTWSVGNAVLIFGDTNSRYSRTNDTAIRTLLDSDFTDAWVKLERDGVVPTVESLCENPQASNNNTCETVDKVFYRSSPLLTLDATTFEYVGTWFLQADGNVTTDHNPVNVNFTWAAGTSLRQSGYWGGPHGTWFSDIETLSAIDSPTVSELVFRGSERLDSVGVVLADGTNLTHGGTGGTEATLTLGDGEYWTAATLCEGQYNSETRNFYINATTSAGNTVSAGEATDDCADFNAPDGWAIVGFVGQDGDEVDQLALVYGPQA